MDRSEHQPDVDERKRRTGLWAAGIFTVAGLAFLILYLYVLGVLRNWTFQFEDLFLTPLIIFLLVTSIASFSVIRRGRLELGAWLLISINLISPFVSALVLNDSGYFSLIFIIIFTTSIILWVLPTSSRRIAGIATATTVVTILLIEIWDPPFRVEIRTIAPTNIIMSLMAITIIAFLIWQIARANMRVKLLATLSLIPLLTILVVGGYLGYNFVGELVNQSISRSLFDVERKASKIEDFLSSAESDVLYLSQSPALHDYLSLIASVDSDVEQISQAKSHLNYTFTIFAQTKKIYDQVRFLDANGQEVVRINTSRDGVSTIVPDENMQNTSGRYYFDDTFELEEGGLMISPLDLNIEQGQVEVPHKPVIRYGTPVFVNGEKVGVIVINILADYFLEPLGELPYLTFLVDTDGYYLYHPEVEKRWGRDLDTETTLASDKPGVLQRLLTGEESTFEVGDFTYISVPVVIPGQEITKWYLVNFIDTIQVYTPVRENMIPFILLVLVVLGIIVLVANFLSRAFTEPLLELTQTAVMVSEGNLDVEARISSQDEIGILATTFNNMTSRLRETLEGLEQHVADRTLALEASTIVARRLTTILDQDELVHEVVEQVKEAFNYYHAYIYLFDDEKENLLMVGGTGDAGQIMLGQGHKIAKGQGLVGRSGESNLVVLVKDVSTEEGWLPNPLLPETRSEIAVPIAIGENVLGVLDVQDDEPGGLAETDADLLQLIANQVAAAMQNARRYQESQDQAQREAKIADIGQRIQNSTSVEDALKVAVRELSLTLGKDTFVQLMSEKQ